MYTPYRPRRGFTLIELLTVIAIIGILAAIIIPTVGKVRQTAKTAQGVSNLRQIALATLSYAADNKDLFPHPQKSVQANQPRRNFYTELSTYLNRAGDGTDTSPSYSDLFKDPLAAIDGGDNHYTANHNMMRENTPRRTSAFKTPSQSVMYFDGAQVHSPGNADLSGWAVDNGGLNEVRASDRSGTWLETAVNPGPNTDAAYGNIRWRQSGGTAAKFAFLDGHVSVLKPADVKRRHFVLD